MRLLAVDHYAGSPHQLALYRALASDHGFEVTLLVPTRWYDGFTEQSADANPTAGIHLVAAQTYFLGKSHRAFTPHLWRLLRRERFDIMFLNAEPESFQALHASVGRSFYAPSTRLAVISWRNIMQPRGVYPYRLGWLHHYAESKVLSRLDGLVAHNGPAQAIFETRTGAAIQTTPPCIDIDLYSGSSPITRDRSEGAKRFAVGYAGRLVQEKGLDTLLRACSQIGIPREIHIYGTGPDERRLRKVAASLGIVAHVRWHGGIPQRELPGHLSALDVLVLPSRTTELWKEQFGRILIEAMAAGVPVIGSDSGEIPTTIGSAGLVFPEGDVTSLRDQLLHIQSDQELRSRLVEAGRQRVREKFSSSAVARDYAAFFNRICAAK